jgi:3-oxoacyl-[acyl-carrier-protein] synthase III
MLIGEVYLEALASGIITQEEIDWLTTHQARFSRDEEAKALQIGRLLDGGHLQIGCRLLAQAAQAEPA